MFKNNKMIIFVKNMVCDRCIMAIRNILEQNKIAFNGIILGEIYLQKELTFSEKENLSKTLEAIGFELIDDKKQRIVEKIKAEVIQLIHYTDEKNNQNTSDYLAKKLDIDYKYLSNLFSEKEGVTIEKYLIIQKIERAKELLVYDELSLSEIAHQLNYSSVAYLSNQFKKITGFTPSHFKNMKTEKRKPLDKII